jgi:hypothetical protein
MAELALGILVVLAVAGAFVPVPRDPVVRAGALLAAAFGLALVAFVLGQTLPDAGGCPDTRGVHAIVQFTAGLLGVAAAAVSFGAAVRGLGRSDWTALFLVADVVAAPLAYAATFAPWVCGD